MNLRRDRAGRGTMGCLGSVALLVIVFYLAIRFLPPWIHYEQFLDEMRSEARYAVTLPDSVIRARLVAQADTLGLPPEARRIVITHSMSPAHIQISAQYIERVYLPIFGVKLLHFHPSAGDAL